MLAAEILAERCWIFCFDPFPDKPPGFWEGLRRSSHLEVVHVDYQKRFELLVPEDRSPFAHRLETSGLEIPLAMPFPVPPRIGVSIQGKAKTSLRPFHMAPAGGPPVPRQLDPGRGVPTQFRLDVRLFGVCDLNAVAVKKAISIGTFTR